MKINNKVTTDLQEYILKTYDVDVKSNDNMNDLLLQLQDCIDDALLSRYFQADDQAEQKGTYWKNQLAWNIRKTGQQMLEKMQALNPEKILDVGCGDNEWKKYFGDKLLGIDPFNKNADVHAGILEFNRGYNTWDIVMCLGSINFGDKEIIKAQVECAVKLCKPGGKIYFRCNPGITHDNKHAKWIDFFPWSKEILEEFATKFGCEINEISWDQPEDREVRWGNRIYSEWTKLAIND